MMKHMFVVAVAMLALEATAHTARTCQELAYLNSSLPDGEYKIQCAPNGKFKAYCHKLASGSAQEFLSLPATGTKSKLFGNPFPVNSATYKCGQNCKGANPNDSTLTTVYSKIRINPCSFEVDITDTTFAKTTGKIHDIGNPTWEKNSEPFAVAESCESGQDPGFANIDLSGTNFGLNTTFATGGAGASGTTTFFDKQRAVVQGDGYCGHRSPARWSEYPASSRKPGHPQYVLQLALWTPTPPAPPAIKLCKDQGCGTYDRSQTCHCDDYCNVYGNCCSDYAKVCSAPPPKPAIKLCKDQGCGTYDRSQTCHCDDYCNSYGNCCSDYAKVCMAANRDKCATQGCGTYDPSRDTCHCDENCEDYDNCCSDYKPVCKAGNRDKCATQGCGTYDPSSDSCHCDENCENYGNCCSDYEPVCKAGNRDKCATQGCGTYDPSRDSCYCDENCEADDNCCSDYKPVCKANDKCATQGCGTYDPSRDSCHCDENCENYDNCCSDYEPVCKAGNRDKCAVQRCGTYDPSDDCHCDVKCEADNNCCSDYDTVCHKARSILGFNLRVAFN